MHIVHVFVHVKPNAQADFEQATLANAEASLTEPGVARFDVVRQQDDPQRFVLVEVYRSPEAASPTRRRPTTLAGGTPSPT